MVTAASLLFAGALLFGCVVYIIRKLAALLALLSFAVSYYLEGMAGKFRFNLPKAGIKRLILEVCGAICTLFSGSVLIFLLRHVLKQTASELFMGYTRQALSLRVRSLFVGAIFSSLI